MTPYCFYKLSFEEQLKCATMKLLNEYEFYSHSMENRKKLLITADPTYAVFEAKLLAVGGASIFHRAEPRLQELINRGTKFPGKSVSHKLIPSQCHSNAAYLWTANKPKEFKIVTGWALSKDDGMWRQHTWGRYMDTLTIETTLKRQKYFGVILTDQEAASFAKENISSGIS